MSSVLRTRLEKLTVEEQKRRFEELSEKLGLANPTPLDGVNAPEANFPELEEYDILAKMLGCRPEE